MNLVFILPGFGGADLAVAATGDRLWWDPSIVTFLGTGLMRLAPNGIDPGPPDGQQLGVDAHARGMWSSMQFQLAYQLPLGEWQSGYIAYDWRLSLIQSATDIETAIRAKLKPGDTVTIVAHSAGGLVAVLVWSLFKAAGDEGRIRRIITIGTPFQGSYAPIQWLIGLSESIQQLLAVQQWFISAFGNASVKWTLAFLNGVALTWPAFYQLFPALGGSEAVRDPNRALLYAAANYPDAVNPAQDHLTESREAFQPQIRTITPFIPWWVLTTVYGYGIDTRWKLSSASIPLNLMQGGYDDAGDGIVSRNSASLDSAVTVGVYGAHSSLPLDMARDGTLARLILDDRQPPTPKPPPLTMTDPLPLVVTDPPQSEEVTGLVCIGGG